MYGQKFLKPQFSFSNTLSKISGTLNTINKLLPVYEEAKPIISKIKNIFNLINKNKMLNMIDQSKKENNTEKSSFQGYKKNFSEKNVSNSLPTFFQ